MAMVKLTKAQFEKGKKLAEAMRDGYRDIDQDVKDLAGEVNDHVKLRIAEIQKANAKYEKTRTAFRTWCEQHVIAETTGDPVDEPDGPWARAYYASEEMGIGIDNASLPSEEDVSTWLGDMDLVSTSDEFVDSLDEAIPDLTAEVGTDRDDD